MHSLSMAAVFSKSMLLEWRCKPFLPFFQCAYIHSLPGFYVSSEPKAEKNIQTEHFGIWLLIARRIVIAAFSNVFLIWSSPPCLPLGGEDPIEHGVLPAVSGGLQDKHVLDDVEGKAVVWERAQQLSLQEGGPLLLQHTLSSLIALQGHQEHLITVCFNFTGPPYL